MGSEMLKTYRTVKRRDGGICQVCGRRGWDCAHILSRGVYPELAAEARNVVVLCRDCHVAHESFEGRRTLLKLMQEKYGYEYESAQYDKYLREEEP